MRVHHIQRRSDQYMGAQETEGGTKGNELDRRGLCPSLKGQVTEGRVETQKEQKGLAEGKDNDEGENSE